MGNLSLRLECSVTVFADFAIFCSSPCAAATVAVNSKVLEGTLKRLSKLGFSCQEWEEIRFFVLLLKAEQRRELLYKKGKERYERKTRGKKVTKSLNTALSSQYNDCFAGRQVVFGLCQSERENCLFLPLDLFSVHWFLRYYVVDKEIRKLRTKSRSYCISLPECHDE